MEIVSKPDMRSPEEAAAYVKKLRTILRYLGTCDGDMEEGSLRCRRQRLRAAASARRPSAPAARSRTSTPSASSRAPSSTRPAARSRCWRTAARSTRRRACSTPRRARPAPCAPRKRRTTTATSPIPTSCRSSSIRPGSSAIEATLPELPDDKKARFVEQYGLTAYDAGVLVAERASADFFEETAKGRDAKQAANWVINDLFGAPGQGRQGSEREPDHARLPRQAGRPPRRRT